MLDEHFTSTVFSLKLQKAAEPFVATGNDETAE
jgi:hypothetical protein